MHTTILTVGYWSNKKTLEESWDYTILQLHMGWPRSNQSVHVVAFNMYAQRRLSRPFS